MRIIPSVYHGNSRAVMAFDNNLCDTIILVGLTTITITFCIFFALHSPGELYVEEGFRQLPTISLTGNSGQEQCIMKNKCVMCVVSCCAGMCCAVFCSMETHG